MITALGGLCGGFSVLGSARSAAGQDPGTVTGPFYGGAELAKHLREEEDLTVSVLTNPDDTLFVGYTTDVPTGGEYGTEIGLIATAYAQYLDEGYRFGDLEALLNVREDENSRPEPYASWVTRPRWARRFTQGDFTSREYAERVVNTVTPVEEYRGERIAVREGLAEIQSFLNEQGLNISTMREQHDLDVNMFYTPQNLQEGLGGEVLRTEITVLAYAYALLVEQGIPVRQMSAMIEGEELLYRGRWHIERVWAEQFNDARLSEAEYEQRVFETLQEYRVDDYPYDF